MKKQIKYSVSLAIPDNMDTTIIGKKGWYKAEGTVATNFGIDLSQYKLVHFEPGTITRGGQEYKIIPDDRKEIYAGYKIYLIKKTKTNNMDKVKNILKSFWIGSAAFGLAGVILTIGGMPYWGAILFGIAGSKFISALLKH